MSERSFFGHFFAYIICMVSGTLGCLLICPTKFYLYQARGPGSVSQLPVISDIFSIEYTCLKKNMNAFRPSEHPPDRVGGMSTRLGTRRYTVLYTCINRHSGTRSKTKTKDAMNLDTAQLCYIGYRIGWVSALLYYHISNHRASYYLVLQLRLD